MALTQIRLNQITGSAPNNFKPAAFAQGGTTSAILFPDLSGSMGYFAQALANIHGDLEYGNQVPGKIFFTTANNVEIAGGHSAAAQKVQLEQHDGTNANGLQVKLSSTGTANASVLSLQNTAGAAANAVDINALAGGIDIDAQLAVGIDSVAGGITIGGILADGQAMQLGKAGATEISLLPHGTPANEKIAIINTAGTAVDAIKVQAVAGDILLDMDAAGGKIHLDSEGALDVDSVAAQSYTTTDAAGDISFTSAHVAGVAFLIDAKANAGSIVQVDAGILDQNVTGATSLDGASLAQTLSSTYDLDAAGAITMDGASVLVGGDNDTVTITSKSTGGDTTIEVAATGAGHDLILKQSGNQDAGVLVQAAGSGVDSIKLEALAGGIQVNVVDGQAVSLGKGGGAEILIQPHGTPADEKILIDNTAGNAVNAIKMNAAAGGIELASAGTMALNSSAGVIQIGNANVNQGIDIGTAGQRQIVVGNTGASAKLTMKGGTFGLFMSSSADLVLSGGAGQVFAADGAMTSGGGALGMKFANYQEFATFRGKTLFQANTTVLGALNALATSVAGTEPTTFKLKLAAPVTAGAAITVVKIAGDATTLAAHAPQKMQVYYNGQQLLSGSAAEYAAGTADYRVVGNGAARQLNLNFHGAVGDLVQVWDFS